MSGSRQTRQQSSADSTARTGDENAHRPACSLLDPDPASHSAAGSDVTYRPLLSTKPPEP
jgi:hypothetical protein